MNENNINKIWSFKNATTIAVIFYTESEAFITSGFDLIIKI